MEETRVNVRLPVSSPSAQGIIYGAALRDSESGEWEVLGLEVRFESITEGAVARVLAEEAGRRTEGSRMVLPEDPEAFVTLSFDVISRRWLSGAIEA